MDRQRIARQLVALAEELSGVRTAANARDVLDGYLEAADSDGLEVSFRDFEKMVSRFSRSVGGDASKSVYDDEMRFDIEFPSTDSWLTVSYRLLKPDLNGRVPVLFEVNGYGEGVSGISRQLMGTNGRDAGRKFADFKKSLRGFEKAIDRGRLGAEAMAMDKQKIARELAALAEELSGVRTAANARDVLDGYLEAALWAETDDDDEPLEDNYDVSDIDSGSVRDSLKDVKAFLKKAGDLVEADDNDDEEIGHDLWLTRNGHGAGFWDGDYPEAGDELTEIAKRMGEKFVYVGDDGKVYID